MAKKSGKDKPKGSRPVRQVQLQFADKTAERYLTGQLKKAEKLYEDGQYQQVISLLEPLAARYPGQLRVLDQLGLAYARAGLLNEARETFEEAFETAPGPTSLPVQFNLAQVYALTGFNFLAYDLAQKIDCAALARQTGPANIADRCRDFKEDAARLVEQVAAQNGREVSGFLEFGLALDNGRLALTKQELTSAENYFQQAITLEPAITAPYNNLALVYLLDNRLEEAAERSRYVIEQLDPANRTALSLLVRLAVIGERREEAADYLKQLLALPESDQAEDVLKLAEAYAALDDDEAIFGLLSPLLSGVGRLDDLDSAGYQEAITFGVVAAANLGQPVIAARIVRQARPFTHPTLLERTIFALENNERGPREGGRFFYYDPLTAFPPAAAFFQEVLVQLDEEGDALDYRESLRIFYQAYGASALEVAAYKYWIDRDPILVADLLTQAIESGLAGAEELVRRLAFTRAGDDLQRLTAAAVLAGQGLLDRAAPQKIWLGQRLAVGQLDQLERMYQELQKSGQGQAYDRETATLLNEALDMMRQGNATAAIEQYRQVLEKNPQVKQAYQNLAALLSGQGDNTAAIDYLEQALKIDPQYRHAQIALAQLQLATGNLAEAEALLTELAPRIERSAYLDELENFYAARASLYQKQERPAEVKASLQKLLALDPGNEWATALLNEQPAD